MAGTYRRVDVRVWSDKRVRALPERARLLWLWFMTNDQITAVGVMRHHPGAIAHDLGCTEAELAEPVGALLAAGMIRYESREMLWCVWNFVRYNLPDNWKQIISWGRTIDRMPECDLLGEYLLHVREILASEGREALLERFDTAVLRRSGGAGEGMDMGIQTGKSDSGLGMPLGIGNPESETETGYAISGTGSGTGSGTETGTGSEGRSESAPMVEGDSGLGLFAVLHGPPTPVPEAWVRAWRVTFPGLEVRAELLSARQWLEDNPARRKKKIKAFLGGWLRRAWERLPEERRRVKAPVARVAIRTVELGARQ